MLFFFFYILSSCKQGVRRCAVSAQVVYSAFGNMRRDVKETMKTRKPAAIQGEILADFYFGVKYKYVNFTFLNYVSFLNHLVSCSHTGLSYNLSAIASAFCTLSYIFLINKGPSLSQIHHISPELLPQSDMQYWVLFYPQKVICVEICQSPANLSNGPFLKAFVLIWLCIHI